MTLFAVSLCNSIGKYFSVGDLSNLRVHPLEDGPRMKADEGAWILAVGDCEINEVGESIRTFWLW